MALTSYGETVVSEQVLQVFRIAVQQQLSRGMLRNAKLDVESMAEMMGRDAGIRLTAYVLGSKECVARHFVERPVTWWDHWKQAHASWWWVKRWLSSPRVERHELTVEARLLFPDIAGWFLEQNRYHVVRSEQFTASKAEWR